MQIYPGFESLSLRHFSLQLLICVLAGPEFPVIALDNFRQSGERERCRIAGGWNKSDGGRHESNLVIGYARVRQQLFSRLVGFHAAHRADMESR